MARIKDLIHDMSDYGISYVGINEKFVLFSQIELISDVATEVRTSGNTLFVGTASCVCDNISRYSGGIYLLISDQAKIPENFIKRNTVVLYEAVINPDILYEACRKWLRDFNKYLENAEQIFEIVLDDSENNLYHLLDKAAVFLKNPIVLLDANCKILAYSHTYETEDNIWKQNILRGYCTYEQIMEMQAFDASGDFSMEKPKIVSSDFCQSRIWLHKLKREEEVMGTLVILEESMPFSKMDKRLSEKIAQTSALMIYNNYERLRTLNEYSEDNIFIECLSGEHKSYSSFLERIRNTTFNNPCNYRVAIIDVEKFENFDPRKEILRSYFNKIFHRAWMLWYRGNVVAIIDTHNTDDVGAIFEKNRSFFEEKNLRLGVSDEFDNIYNIKQYYRQCLSVLNLSGKFGAKNFYVMYNDFKFYDMLQSVAETFDAKQYLDNRLFVIEQYDLNNNTEYYTTIERYIFSGQNLSRTAEELHVHKNTVSYRMNRAKEIFSLSLDDVQEVFQLMYSYKLKKIMDECTRENEEQRNGDKYPFDFLC
jgi:sugar diacid utilization regulator